MTDGDGAMPKILFHLIMRLRRSLNLTSPQIYDIIKENERSFHMYLLPTDEELKALWREIDPKERFLRSAREAINTLTEDAIMPYFDDIEDDIISMRCDVNGFKLHIPAPRYLEHNPNSGHLNFKGWTYEYVNRDTEQDIEMLKTLPNSQFVDSWDDI